MAENFQGGPASQYPRDALLPVEFEAATGEVIELTHASYEVCSICEGKGKVASEIAPQARVQCSWCSGCGGWWTA